MITFGNTQHFYYNIIDGFCHIIWEWFVWKEEGILNGYTKDGKQFRKSTKKLAKNLKKGVDIKNALWYYIQVDAIRHWNKAKVARQEKCEPWKLNNNLLKSECAGRALSKRETKSN